MENATTHRKLKADALKVVLQDQNVPMDKRIRTIWSLREIGGVEAVEALQESMRDSSELLAHEAAYGLGQIRHPAAIPYLNSVLEDETINSMVRHEAAESLGAIGDQKSIDILEKYKNHSITEIAETCQVSLDLIRWKQANKEQADLNVGKTDYLSVDPAPPSEKEKSVKSLLEKLLNNDLTIFERYRALFALRNIGTEEAVLAIVEGFKDKSALFRHEIAYVLGQVQHPASLPGLINRLEDQAEHMMVRHEAAEAIGSIAQDDTLPLLQKYAKDKARVSLIMR
eukprot:TRINITY_DN1009_c0_g1_i4.p1 TRINITY_DN1009_c0_g1~~TRINITY_DN1009_c0_g1_i4.p1  ORF type:complete len:302 (+),score=48.34 TRINITY_DN1009_c0_g1_i4:55-906(+)